MVEIFLTFGTFLALFDDFGEIGRGKFSEVNEF